MKGDRASKGAFRDFIDIWRKPTRDMGQDPFGEESTAKIAKERLTSGDPEAAGVIQSAPHRRACDRPRFRAAQDRQDESRNLHHPQRS
jgi:hypothetical protein